MSPRDRVDACRELRAVATSGSESTPARGDQFIIRIDLTAGGDEVVEFNKALQSSQGATKRPRKALADTFLKMLYLNRALLDQICPRGLI
jgi:hypothetical protein